MDVQQPSQAQVQIVYAPDVEKDKLQSFEKECEDLKSLLRVANGLKLDFEKDVSALGQMHASIADLKQDMLKVFSDIGVISEFLKQSEEKNRKVTAAILTIVKRENTRQDVQITGLQTSISLSLLEN